MFYTTYYIVIIDKIFKHTSIKYSFVLILMNHRLQTVYFMYLFLMRRFKDDNQTFFVFCIRVKLFMFSNVKYDLFITNNKDSIYCHMCSDYSN